ncbi:MAG: amidohydrolase family protein [Candidatus Acidiferrales bacterium]
MRQFYYDTVNFEPPALKLAVDFASVEHILAGSDYPHQFGSIPEMLTSLRSLPIPAADKDKILGANPAKLLRL